MLFRSVDNIQAATVGNGGGNGGAVGGNAGVNAGDNGNGATGNVAFAQGGGPAIPANTVPNTVSALGAVNTVGQTLNAAPADFNLDGTPNFDDMFNFNDGTEYNLETQGLVPGSLRAEQARNINSVIPTSVQFAFRRGDINYYDPGNSRFYYLRARTSSGNYNILQVDRATNSYRSADDGQIHFINIDMSQSNLNFFTSDAMNQGGMQYTIQNGDTLENLAQRFGMSVSMLRAANPGINSNGDIVAGNTLNMPALAYNVNSGDTLSSIASDVGVDADTLARLNPEVTDVNFLSTGQNIRVPTTVPGLPMSRTIQDGESLPLISSLLGLDQTDLENLNPGLANLGTQATGQIAAIPNFLTTTGNVVFRDTTENPLARRNWSGIFGNRAVTTSRKHPRAMTRQAITV